MFWSFFIYIIIVEYTFQQGKKVKSISGFSGRGFKFDETEEAMAKERKQIQKAALGLQDSDEDEPAQNVSNDIKIIVGSLCFSKPVSFALLRTLLVCPVSYCFFF